MTAVAADWTADRERWSPRVLIAVLLAALTLVAVSQFGHLGTGHHAPSFAASPSPDTLVDADLGVLGDQSTSSAHVYDSGRTPAAMVDDARPEITTELDERLDDRAGSAVEDGYDDRALPASALARPRGQGLAPNTAAGLGDDLVRFDPQWASRQLAGQNLPGSTGWATTPGGRTLSVHAAERTFLGGPGRAPIAPGLIDDILAQGTRVSYRGLNDTIRIGAPNLCGRCYVVVDAQNVNHIVTVMVPK